MARSSFLLLDKPEGITSHDLIVRARKILGTRKIGHAGTLDPMATGLMVLGVESATRLLDYVMAGKKRYLATIKVGTLTITDDRMGEVISTQSVDDAVMDAAEAALRKMVGVIEQIPARVSAIKVDGKRSYDLVRDGKGVELAPRKVEIFDLAITARGEDTFEIDLSCSPGTYVRAIARDVGGHLTALRRIESAPFTIDDCRGIESAQLLSPAVAISRVLSTYPVNANECSELALGRSISFDESKVGRCQTCRSDVIAAISPAGEVVALLNRIDSRLQPTVVLPECRSRIHESKFEVE